MNSTVEISDKDLEPSQIRQFLPNNTDENISNKKPTPHNSLAKGSKKIMNKLLQLSSRKSNVSKYKEEDNRSTTPLNDNKHHQTREVQELLKSEANVTRNIKSLNKEKKINDTIVAIISFLSIILSFIQLYSLIDSNYETTDYILTLRTCILILSIPNLIFLYRRYNINIDIRKYNLKLRESTLWTSGYYKTFILEILLNIIQPFPYVEFTFHYNQGDYRVKLSFSHICTVLMMIRVYLTYKLLNHYNIWTNARSKRVCALQDVEANSVFATKVLLKNSPIVVLILVSTLFLFIFSFLLKGFEFFDKSDDSNDFKYLWNSMWLNFITMTTVGYGDLTPTTNFGKVFCVISCLVGVFLLSMLVAVLSLHVFFDSEELKVYRKIIEKEIVYSEMPLEIREVFNILSEMFLTKEKEEHHNYSDIYPMTSNITRVGDNNHISLLTFQKLLLRFKLKKLNEKKKMILVEDEDETEKYLDRFDLHLDLDFGECMNKTVSVVKNQKKLYDIAHSHPKMAAKVFDSKDYANRIANLANLMRVISTCGKIQNIYDIEGGRLFTRKELIDYQRYFYYDSVYNMKKMDAIGGKSSKNSEKLLYSKSNLK